jgi:hypothetical protein
MAGVSYGTGDILFRDYFQRRGGKSKRPFRILRPVEIRSPAASVAGRDRESLDEEALWVAWIPYTKSRLESIQKLTRFSLDRLSDKELGKFLQRMITEDIRRSGLLLDGLFDYFQVTAAKKRTDTVQILIEEVLKKNRTRLEEKKVKLFKKLERGLPEPIIPDKPLGFILNSILQYAVASMSSNEPLGLLTRSFALEGPPPGQALFGKGGRYVEITVFFAGRKKPPEPLGREMEIGAIQREDSLGLILRMVKEMVRRNGGTMKFRVHEKEENLSISLVFPVERRRAFHNPYDN